MTQVVLIFRLVSPDMKLQPNIGSDRSWVCKVHADYADESAPVSITLAIRFANANGRMNIWTFTTRC